MRDRVEVYGGLVRVAAEIAAGKTFMRIAEELQTDKTTLWRFMAAANPEEKEMLAEARKLRAVHYMDEALQIIDNAPETQAGVNKAKLRAEQRRHLAALDDPERYSPKPETSVQVNVVGLHLDALRLLRDE